MSLPGPNERELTQAWSQASVWLARLHSDDRTQDDIDAFYRWLNADSVHQSAFDAVTTSWELAGGLKDIPRRPFAAHSRRNVLVGACAGVCAVGAVGFAALRWNGGDPGQSYTSDIGEIRRIALADGSHMMLDTDSAVHVRLDGRSRAVTLLKGRTHVDVARDTARPFSVTAHDQQVIARGTAFDVALAPDGMQVLLTEGLVDVIGKGGDRNALTPGQRLRYAAGSVQIDEPDPVTLLAWQQGRLVFDNETLVDAVSAMNRYDRRKIVVADPSLRDLRLSGSYATGNTGLFAQSISQLLDIRLVNGNGSIMLYGHKERADPAT